MNVKPGKSVMHYLMQLKVSVAHAPGGKDNPQTRANCLRHWVDLARKAGVSEDVIQQVKQRF